MKRLTYFCKYALLSFVLQGIIWFTLGRSDAFVEKFIYLYYPTIRIVERFGNFSGESRLIEPIWIGVPLGAILYSIILASLLTFVHHSKANSQASVRRGDHRIE